MGRGIEQVPTATRRAGERHGTGRLRGQTGAFQQSFGKEQSSACGRS